MTEESPVIPNFHGESDIDTFQRTHRKLSGKVISEVTKLQDSLSGWREVILPLHTVLSWDKQWHPCTIVGASTIFFMTIWLLDPSLITTLAILALTMTVSDYFVPYLTSVLLKNEPWSEKKQEKLDLICHTLIIYKQMFTGTLKSFYTMRTDKPKIFYGASICSLLILAWIGNNVNNLFLTYLVITFTLLLPGLERHGFLQKYCAVLTEKIAQITSPKLKEN